MIGTASSRQNRLSFTPEVSAYFAGINAPIIVTGATGWLGRTTLEMLDCALGKNLKFRVCAFSNSDNIINLRSGNQILSRNLKSLDGINLPPAIIFHYAFLTREHSLGLPLTDYVNVNNEITRIVCDAVMRKGAYGIFVPSSGAVYGTGRRIENDLHSNPYGVMKSEDEVTFQSLARKLGFPCAIMRVFNLAGPFINKLSSYALASIICDAASGGPIILRANKPVIRSYAYAEDVVNLAAAMIKQKIQIEPFDTAGERTIEIGELAGAVARIMLGRSPEIIRPNISETEKDFYCGDKKLYFELAKKIGLELKNLDRQISSTIHYIQSMP